MHPIAWKCFFPEGFGNWSMMMMMMFAHSNNRITYVSSESIVSRHFEAMMMMMMFAIAM
jgi:hypothetical protein